MVAFTRVADAYWGPLPRHALPVPLPAPLASKADGLDFMGHPAGDDLDPKTIKKVTAVGALYHEGLGGLHPNDVSWVTLALQACRRFGFNLAQDIDLSPLNLAAGRDFLCPQTPPVPADLIVCCFVSTPSAGPALPKDRVPPSLVRSDRHNEVGAWREAAHRACAKIVLNYAQETERREIGIHRFFSETLIPMRTKSLTVTCEWSPVAIVEEACIRNDILPLLTSREERRRL